MLTAGCCLALLTAGGVAYAASISRADREFLDSAATIDMTEAHEGQMAQNGASRPEVKQFAQTLVQDYTNSYGQIAELAAKENVTIPKGINAVRIRPIEQLGSLKGAQFDRQFAREQIVAEQRAIAVFKREAEHGENADVKAYAAKTVPVLEKDLKQAQALH